MKTTPRERVEALDKADQTKTVTSLIQRSHIPVLMVQLLRPMQESADCGFYPSGFVSAFPVLRLVVEEKVYNCTDS